MQKSLRNGLALLLAALMALSSFAALGAAGDISAEKRFDVQKGYSLRELINGATVYGYNRKLDLEKAYVPVSIALDRQKVSLQPGRSVKVNAKLTLKNDVDVPMAWSSSDESVATVNESGRVFAHKTGVCVITAQAGTAVAPLVVEVNTEKVDYPAGKYGESHNGYYLVVRLYQLEYNYNRACADILAEVRAENTPPAPVEEEEKKEIVEESTEEELVYEVMEEAEDDYVDDEPIYDEEPDDLPEADTTVPMMDGDDEYYEDEEDEEYDGETIDTSGERYTGVTEQPFIKTSAENTSTVSVDVDTASYANVRRFIREVKALPPNNAVRIEEMVNYFSYDYPAPEKGDPVNFTAEVFPTPWNPDTQLVKLALQTASLETENAPDSNLVLLLDTSGSMYSDDKLPLLIDSFKAMLPELKKTDTVSIVTYAGSTAVLMEGVGAREVDIISLALDSLSAGGSTYGQGGLTLAYGTAGKYFLKDGNNRVILGTDGDFNVGFSSTEDMEAFIAEKRETGIYLTVLGFGMGNYRDDMVKTLSVAGNGNYAYIDSIEEAEKVLVAERNATMLTVAEDVKWQIEWNEAAVEEYRLVGYDMRVLANEDFDDDSVDAGEMGAGHSVTVFYEIVPAKNAPADADYGALRLRYKQPGGDSSKLYEEAVTVAAWTDKASSDGAFAAAVAEYALILKDSAYKGEADLTRVLANARANLGRDASGYRADFVKMVEETATLYAREDGK